MPPLEELFELLFKYKPFVFAQGQWVLLGSWPSLGVGALLALAGWPAMRRYRLLGGKSTARDRILLLALRLAALSLLLFCLLRPALVVATAVPLQNFVGLLVDDSLSMQIADVAEQPRGERVLSRLAGAEGLLAALRHRFKLRTFAFSSVTRRVDKVEALRFDGERTDLAAALENARRQLGSLPVSGLVLISDGAVNAGAGLAESLAALGDAGIPVFTVGVGRDQFSRDLEVAQVQVPHRVLLGSSVGADVVVRQHGYDGQSVQLFVEDEGRILSTHTVDLPRGADATVVRTRFVAEEDGPRMLTFRLAPLEGEMVRQNNEATALVSVRDEVRRILYFEGEPRWEVAFIRRALQHDENLAVVKLVMTADNKFWREIVDPEDKFGGENELFEGFPRTREQLYAYDGLILGSVPARLFTPDQQQMIADFVSQRGGGLLALGGRQAFARGGWRGTPLEPVLPVQMPEQPVRGVDGAVVDFSEVKILPTLFGRSHPAVQLAETPEENLSRWQRLPPLVTVNPMSRTRAGAATLLEGHSDLLPEPQVILAYQRYGAGKAIVFNVVDSWQWQMHHDIPLQDQTHETLWRQLLRWLAGDVRGPVQASLSEDVVSVGGALRIRADVFDDTYLAVNNATVSAEVTSPSGKTRTVSLPWDVSIDGRYEATFGTDEEGFHTVRVRAQRAGHDLGEDRLAGRVTRLSQEFFNAQRNRELLRRIAAETGGRYYDLGHSSALVDDLRFTEGGTTVTEVLDLWDMPIIFVLLVGLVGAEWTYRKLKRLA